MTINEKFMPIDVNSCSLLPPVVVAGEPVPASGSAPLRSAERTIKDTVEDGVMRVVERPSPLSASATCDAAVAFAETCQEGDLLCCMSTIYCADLAYVIFRGFRVYEKPEESNPNFQRMCIISGDDGDTFEKITIFAWNYTIENLGPAKDHPNFIKPPSPSELPLMLLVYWRLIGHMMPLLRLRKHVEKVIGCAI